MRQARQAWSEHRDNVGLIRRLRQLRLEHVRRHGAAVEETLADMAAGILDELCHHLGFHALGHHFQAEFRPSVALARTTLRESRLVTASRTKAWSIFISLN